MKTLGFPDQHHLNSAIGWLGLGNPAEARAEANKISIFGRVHQDTFVLRWRIAARMGAWEEARRLAEVFTRVAPHLATGWICLSFSLYSLDRRLEAWMQLVPRLQKFPTISAIPYILACYAWEQGNEHLASQFLARSSALGGPSQIKGTSLALGDLQTLAGLEPDNPKPEEEEILDPYLSGPRWPAE